MFKWVLSVLVLLSVLSAQKRWYRGNMEGMGEFTMDISVNGLEAVSYTHLTLPTILLV